MLTVYVVGVLLTFMFQFVLVRGDKKAQQYEPVVLGASLVISALLWPATILTLALGAVLTVVGSAAQKKVEPGAKSKSNVVY